MDSVLPWGLSLSSQIEPVTFAALQLVLLRAPFGIKKDFCHAVAPTKHPEQILCIFSFSISPQSFHKPHMQNCHRIYIHRGVLQGEGPMISPRCQSHLVQQESMCYQMCILILKMVANTSAEVTSNRLMRWLLRQLTVQPHL